MASPSSKKLESDSSQSRTAGADLNSEGAVADGKSAASDSGDAGADAVGATADGGGATADGGGATADGGGATADGGGAAADDSGVAEADAGVFESLMSLIEQKLKLKKSDGEEPPVLQSVDVAGVVAFMQSGRCKNIITMAGAGISTSAGIPDFRSPGSGLYSNLQKYDLPYPEAIFELGFFRQNPQPFFTLAKELYPGSFNPTPSHFFVKLLEEKGLLLRHYTQNIDTLEHVAGISESKLIEAHGSFRTAHCLGCRKSYNQDWIKDEVFADRVPSCESCGAVVKPDIVFFGEALPDRFYKAVATDFRKCDLLIVMGTSLTVQPFASLIDNVPPKCPRLLINRDAVGVTGVAATLQRLMGKGQAFQPSKNKRDVALIGDCDDGCFTLARQLGWQDDLQRLITEGKKKS
ncbi:NAD-dependent protein deacetylase Sirt2 isoform X2 [Hyalella azteca]|uniref:NAD-dependent protein deacetylase Sirt2 isoform X2 n=1 Tax=Hyalella azteca TaxID=294128 RepID=A0A8B7NBF7_HYAAZ|nr:NAD-dependent protein deacetylase Sirt2 isoform X2 [Hyalella azteca]